MTPLVYLCIFLFNHSIVALYHDLRGQSRMTCALKLMNYVLVKLIGLKMIFHLVSCFKMNAMKPEKRRERDY